MATVKTLKFSYNWNNKLYCKYWTTLRKWNERKYQVGYVYDIHLNDEYLGTAELVSVRKTKSADLNQFVCGLDTGYSVAKTLEVLKRMYRGDPGTLFFGLFRWVKIHPGCSIDLKSKKNG